jgi:acyl dehydratase
MGVNYGADKIRFMSPVPVGARIRASATLDDAKQFEGGVQMTLGITMEIENQPKPAMVAAILFRRYL